MLDNMPYAESLAPDQPVHTQEGKGKHYYFTFKMKNNQSLAVAAFIFHGLCALLANACVHTFVRTDVCSNGFSPCGVGGFCCCSKTVAACARFGQGLTYIPVLPFRKYIFFQENNLRVVNQSTFRNITQAPKLSRLSLCNNDVRQVAPDAFRQLTTMTNLELSDNVRINLSALSNAFKDCISLNNLALQNVGITTVDHKFFVNLNTTRLTSIDLSRNRISTLDVSSFALIKNLRHLILKQCNIKRIEVPTQLPVLESLTLRENLLVHSPPTFCLDNSNNTGFPRLTSIDLSGNRFSELEGNFLDCVKHLMSLRINGNEIKVLRNKTFSKFHKLEDLSVSNMAGTLKHIEVLAFHLPQLRQLSVANNGIHFKWEGNTRLLKGLTNLQSLELSDNNFDGIDPDAMADMVSSLKPLSKLSINSAKVSHIYAAFINQLPNLSSCNLKGNQIREINGAFNNATKLTELTLKNNKINVIRPNDFARSLFETLREIDLSSNPYRCTCDLMWFRSSIGDSGIIINTTRLESWPRGYTCQHGRTPTLLKDYHPTTKLCTPSYTLTLVMSVSFSIVSMTILLTSAVAYRKRVFLYYWFYKTRKRLFHNPEIIYDAYVVYHDNDSEFVHGELREMLEGTMNNRLHIWQRDADPGPVLDVMVDAIYASRSVLAVVSSPFIHDSWCKFQMGAAFDRYISWNQQDVFLIILNDFENKELDSDWCVILTRTPSSYWCDKKEDLRRQLFDQQIKRFFNKIKIETHHSRYGTI